MTDLINFDSIKSDSDDARLAKLIQIKNDIIGNFEKKE